MKISFTEEIISTDFEKTLKKFYYKSKFQKNKNIEFDFTNVTWFGIFELSLISLWLKELLNMQKVISVNFPSEQGAHDFLIDYRFNEFLIKNAIKIKYNLSLKSYQKPRHLFKAPFYPLTFFNESIFNKIIEDLFYGNRLEIIFKDIRDTEIVKSGAIRDVVLYELGKNIFYHSKTNLGNLIMTRYIVSSNDIKSKNKWRDKQVSRSSNYEKSFFEKLGGEPYLELIISDKGKGIFNTLLKAYLDDDIIADKVERPTEKIILEYSFLYHSTSRTITEREGEIYNIISQETKKFPSPTGLYRLKNIVRDYHGLLYMRSGSTVICYDFYKNKSDSDPKTNEKKKLTPFGGTQFKLLFPLEIPSRKIFPTSSFDQTALKNGKEKPLCSELIDLKTYVESKEVYSLEDQAKFLFNIFNEIEKRKNHLKGRQSCLIIDGLKDIQLLHKAQHYLIYEALNRQEEKGNFAILITNVDSKILSAQKDFIQFEKKLNRALVLFTERMEPYFLGLNANERRIAYNIIHKTEKPENNNTKKFVEKNSHLFTYNEFEDHYSFIYTRQRLNNLIKNRLKSKISKIILDINSFIFLKDHKVLLPSKYYCQGYFEIYKLLTDSKWREIVVSYFKYVLLESKPDFIISITGCCGKLIDEVLEVIKELDFDLKPIHLNFTTPIKGVDYLKIIFKIDKEKTGILITDVIGTSNTVKSILENCRHIKITKIFSFVNAKENQESYIANRDINIPIDCTVMHKLHYTEDLPPRWFYRDIYVVEPLTNTLIINPSKSKKSMEPIWKQILPYEKRLKGKKIEGKNNNFLSTIVFPIGAFDCGHFISKDKHLLYLFNIPKITNYFSQEIANIIIQDANQYLQGISPPTRISHIIYPSFKPGLQNLAFQVSSKFQKSEILEINFDEFVSSYDQNEPNPFIEGALIIDSEIVSDKSIYRLLEIAERKGAKDICIYILIKRGSDYNLRVLEKTPIFGHSSYFLRYLSEVQLPVYSTNNCPICYKINELSNLIDLIKNYTELNELIIFIKKKISKLSHKNIDEVMEESLLTSETAENEKNKIKLYFRWKLEIARTDIGVRNELATIVSDFKNPLQNVLVLLNIIAEEKSYFLINKEISEIIFYKTFKKSILSACKFYLQDLDNISEENLESIIVILRSFDSNYLIDNLYFLLDPKKLDLEKFFQICIQLLLSQRSQEYPSTSRIISALKELFIKIQSKEATSIIPKTTDGLINYWQSVEDFLIKSKQQNLVIYKKLQGTSFHNLKHAFAGFFFSIKVRHFNTEGIKYYWDLLDYTLDEILKNCRNFIGLNTRHDIVGKIENCLNRLNIQREKCRKIVLELSKNKSDGLNNDEITLVSNDLNTRVERIKTLILGEEGIRALLIEFRTNIKIIIQKILDQYSERFVKKGIIIKKSYTDKLCFVFGHNYHVYMVCVNLIENVYKKSNASLLEIVIQIDIDKKIVSLEILDNGNGFDAPVIYQGGLKTVNEYVSLYNGQFYGIERISRNSKLYTSAKFDLPLIKEKYPGGEEND